MPEAKSRQQLNPETLLELLQESHALLEGHFRLSSGLHSSRYLQCALLLQDPARAERVGRALASACNQAFDAGAFDVVAGPALGAVIIGHEVARALGKRFIFTERDADARAVLRRGFAVSPGERVLVIEDVVTTGLSTQEVIKVLNAAGADTRGVGCIVNRSGGRAEFGMPLAALLELDVPAWKPEECELCRQGLPVIKPGSRAK